MRRSALPLALLLLACSKPKEDATTTPEPVAPTESVAAEPEAEAPAEPVDQEAAEREEALQRARSAPPPAGLAAGLVSDFESGELRSEFGAGWQKATDEMVGGASTVELEVVSDGPDGSPNALYIRGTIAEGSAEPWAGAMFLPGDRPMEPANLLSKPTITFSARGDGPLMVMVYADQNGTTPATTTVEIGEEWGRYEVDIRALVADPYDVTAIVFGLPGQVGTWEQWIDDVRLR